MYEAVQKYKTRKIFSIPALKKKSTFIAPPKALRPLRYALHTCILLWCRSLKELR